jgi:tetratricopeptide (TPR) repeat protein
MKTERRHELQENELATWLGDQIMKLQPYLKAIAGGAVLLAVVFLATSYLNARNEEAQQEAWAGYFAALATGDPAEFQKVAETYPGTIAAGWSLQSAGDLLLNQGIGELFRNRETAKTQLEAALQTYKTVTDAYSDAMLQQRAYLGLAKAEESLGNFDQAKKHYQQITEKWSESEMADLAADRLAQLDRPGTKEWYDWFAQQEPVTSPLDMPGFLNDLPNLPDQPNINLPQPGELLGSEGQAADDGSDLPGGDDLPAGDQLNSADSAVESTDVDGASEVDGADAATEAAGATQAEATEANEGGVESPLGLDLSTEPNP